MRRNMKAICTFILVACLQVGSANAQRGPRGFNFVDEANAAQTRQQLAVLLAQYPPSVRHVLQTDPALLTNKDYLAPYPSLESFIAKHPEIEHNASFFLGNAVVGPMLVDR